MKKIFVILFSLFLIGCSTSNSDSSDYDPEGIAYSNNIDSTSGFTRTSGTTGIIGDWAFIQEYDSELELAAMTLTLSFKNNGTFLFTRNCYDNLYTISGTYNLYTENDTSFICCKYGPYTDTQEYCVTDTDFTARLYFIMNAMYSNY